MHIPPLAACGVPSRLVVKELEGYREPLQKLLAKLRVTAQADKKYAMFQPELTKNVQDLGGFIDKSLDSIWQFEALPIEKVSGMVSWL